MLTSVFWCDDSVLSPTEVSTWDRREAGESLMLQKCCQRMHAAASPRTAVAEPSWQQMFTELCLFNRAWPQHCAGKPGCLKSSWLRTICPGPASKLGAAVSCGWPHLTAVSALATREMNPCSTSELHCISVFFSSVTPIYSPLHLTRVPCSFISF